MFLDKMTERKVRDKMEKMPVLALRDLTVVPGITMYFEVGRKWTIAALDAAMHGDQRIFAVAQKEPETEEPGVEDLYETGTVSVIKQLVRMPDNVVRVILVGEQRGKLQYLESVEEHLQGAIELLEEQKFSGDSLEEIAMVRGLKNIFHIYAGENGRLNQQNVAGVMEGTDLVQMMYQIIACIPVHYQLKQQLLEESDIRKRYEALSVLLNREISILRIQGDIAGKVKEQVDKNQKEYYLREQLKAIHKELGEEDTSSESDKYLQRLEKLKASKKVKKKIREEIGRFEKMSSNSSESNVVRGYIETLLQMPWKKVSKDNVDINYARKVLDDEHYGLEKVKERVLECLAVKVLKKDGHSPIICLVGPPGTGKTSIARSVAKAMNRKYVRICLGGVRDEAEIRGHRRTYVGAMPGRIAAGLRNARVKNPVMVLDEIDKLGSDGRSDPSAALLEVLDPEQNKRFSDHYIELPLDLSQVLFICTANSTDTIPRPLLDRMEVISVSGYTENEKYHIAREHLWGKQKEMNGLQKSQLSITDKALRRVILNYTREAGVRGLEKRIAQLCRKAAEEIVAGKAQKVRISDRNLETYLGKPVYQQNMANAAPETGVVRGLAWTSVGGDTLEIEVCILPGKGELVMTGQLGNVMQESARIACTVVAARTAEKLEEDFYEKHNIHIHVPEGATPKDGPSAGVTMATALYSAVLGRKVRADLAMTGELSLRGRVLPIGGLKEKLLAAKAAGITRVMVPKKNKKDIAELEEEVLDGLKIGYAECIEDIWKEAFV